ncbi:hypothetical protein lerEdw1_010568 [Lerista edwardsae]|nr:hypothetical protein lerEdw1_010568 [Lerista edwardsae]
MTVVSSPAWNSLPLDVARVSHAGPTCPPSCASSNHLSPSPGVGGTYQRPLPRPPPQGCALITPVAMTTPQGAPPPPPPPPLLTILLLPLEEARAGSSGSSALGGTPSFLPGIRSDPTRPALGDRAGRDAGEENRKRKAHLSTSVFCEMFRSDLRKLVEGKRYVIVAPKLLRVGASEKVVIQAFGYEQEFPVTISIKSFPDKQRTYASGRIQLSPSNKFQGAFALMIQPNDLSGRSPNNPILHVYLEAVSSHFTREKKIPITFENGFLFVQTDKPIYTPDQSVKVRVYSLNEELRPARRPATLTFVVSPSELIDCKQRRIEVWRSWKRVVRNEVGLGRELLSTTLEIEKWAMPTFSVTIEPERNFISAQQFERFRITVRASYFYNKRVTSATVYVSFGIVQGSERTMMPRALQQIEMQDGVADCTFNSKVAAAEIGYDDLQQLDGSSLYVAASVLESTGGQSEDSEFLGVQYVLSPYKVDLVATPLFVKPGHPFFIKVQVKDPLGMPAGNIPVILTASALNNDMEENVLVEEGAESGRRQTSQNDGTAIFVVNIPTATKVLEFRVKTADPSLEEENQASREYEAKSYVSLSGSYLYIDWTSGHQTLHVGDSLSLSVHPLSHYIDKIHHYSYLVISKGKIISHGSQERIKDSVYQSLNFQLTKEMVPSARLLVYYIITGEGAAELVADSVWINIKQKCGNNLQVRLSTSKGSFKPGEVIPLSLTTESDSFVALSSVDKAVYGVAGTKKRPMEKALLTLEKSDLGCGAGGGQNNVDVFRMAGLTFLTNANAEDESGTFSLPSPQNWAFLEFFRSSKTLPVTLPDSLTTWEVQGVGISDQGICVADALQVEVVKDFFLNVHVPYSVVRGEQIELRGSVYNYRNSRTRFCTKVTAGEGICLFQGSSPDLRSRHLRHCRPSREVPESSVALVTFKILPLEIGLHTINFTLLSSYGSETLVKTLRVVPEGIRKEVYEGHTLDPQGVYGIVSILSFRKSDFSYSMWKDGESSTWLTAFVLRVLGQVSRYMPVDQNSICSSLTWMIDNCQMSDGSFREISSYMPVKLQGMLSKEQKEKTLYLTAFSLIGFEKTVTICPLQVSLAAFWFSQKIEDAKNKAEDYLLNNFRSAQSTFSLAIVNYALALAKSNQPGARLAFNALKAEALVKGPPMVRFWKESSNKVDRTSPSQHSAKMVETTAYALLTVLLHGDQVYANPIVRWLSEQQRYGGGFYSTQDTINALEALTEYSILVKRLALDMNIRLAYKSHGDFHQYRLTKHQYVGKAVAAPVDDDLEVRTGSNTGLAIVNVRTVYYQATTSEDTCYFDLKIQVKSPNEMNSERGSYYQRPDGPSTLVACAKYRPDRREPRSASSHAVMDISLVSGLEANTEDLSILANGVDRLIANYEIRDGHILAQLDSIPASEFLCIGFRVTEIFRVGMASPGTFTVYEYHTPAECGRMQARLDPSITVDSRTRTACQNNIAYVYKVKILSSKKEGSFVKYTATVLDLYKRGEAFAQKNAEVTFIKKNSCTDVQLNPGEDYLIMGKEALKMGDGPEAKYQYPLDAVTWIEWWPSDLSCGSCQDFIASMEEFADDLFINGC